MRSEKIKRYLIMMLVGVLVLLAPLSYLRVLGSANSLWQVDLDSAFSGSHIITDRDGTELYNGGCLFPETVGNLVGSKELIDNALYNRYRDQMVVGGFNPLVGRSSLKGTTFQTTLMPLAYQQQIQALFGEHDGACFAYNYSTGEVYIALSLPCGLGTSLPDGSMHNGCLNGHYVPGSTMKILTTICALAQDQDLAKFEFNCQKSYTLPDGNVVTCHDYHGNIGLSDALGVSCNCYMAALIRQLDVKETSRTLARLGILNDGTKPLDDDNRGVMDELNYAYGHTAFTSFNKFQSVWGLVGQGDTKIDPVYMAMVAGAVANGGSAAQPRIMQRILECGTKEVYQMTEKEPVDFMDSDTAKMVRMAWGIAVKNHYHNEERPLSDTVTLAKTGTVQEDLGDNDRALLGVMEEYNTAFFIIVMDSEDNNRLIFDIANMLSLAISEM